jgi:Immunity protein Imm5
MHKFQDSYPLDVASTAASDFRSGRESSQELLREMDKLKNYLDTSLARGEACYPAVCAGFSAWAVARDVVSLGCGLADTGSGSSELEITPEDWSPCFFASLALAGGAVWDGMGGSNIRRQFWTWYLLEAVPLALSAV